MVGIPRGGGHTQKLPAETICLNFLYSQAVGMEKHPAHALLVLEPPGETFTIFIYLPTIDKSYSEGFQYY